MTTSPSSHKLNVFTWHVHGNYLLYLTQANCEFYIPVNKEHSRGYAGKTPNFPFGDNVHEVPVDDISKLDLDCIIYQDDPEYLEDKHKLFSAKQLKLPQIYIEHDPPRDNPVDTKHIVDDPDMLLVHVTYFNQLMWDNNQTPTTVIEHGVMLPKGVSYTGEKNKGIVMANNISSVKRGQRRMGYDVFEYMRKDIPLDLLGMGSKEISGLGEVPYDHVADMLSHYRFFFNPIRYTSLGLSVCEAMLLGMPIIGLATTEMSVTIQNGVTGYVHTNLEFLKEKMLELLENPQEAKHLGEAAKEFAQTHFSISRFATEWEETIKTHVTNHT